MFFVFYRSTLVGSAWSFFFSSPHKGQWPPISKDFPSQILSITFFSILILQKELVFPFLMLSAKQGNYWYHFYNVFGMMRSLTGDWTRDLPHLEIVTRVRSMQLWDHTHKTKTVSQITKEMLLSLTTNYPSLIVWTAIILLHAHSQVVYYTCVKFHQYWLIC